MLAQKRKNLGRMKTKAVLETSPRSQMHQRDPGMLLVPDNRRHCANGEYAEQLVQTRALECLSKAGSQCEHQQNRYKLKCVRVFGKKT